MLDRREEIRRRYSNARGLRMSEKLRRLTLRDQPAGPTAVLGIHPTIDPSDVLAGDDADGFNAAKLGDHGTGRVEVELTHSANNCANRYNSSILAIENRNIFSCDFRNNGGMLDQNRLRAWVAAKIAEGGRGTSAALAAHVGLSRVQISRLSQTEPGKEARDIKAHELVRIVDFFGEGPDGSPAPGRAAKREASEVHVGFTTGVMVGPVRAGSWREVDELDQRERPQVILPADPDYPNAQVLVFEIEGDSMNDLSPVPLRPGAHVVCLAYRDIERYYPPRDGMVVVIERRRDGGHLREWSVKQVELHDDRVEFHPRSTNKEHKPIVIAMDSTADDGVEVEIIGLVRDVLFRLRT